MSFPKYDRYKESGVEWLGEVPEHWNIDRLKHNLRLLTEKTERRENLVALENIQSWTGCFIPTETEFEGEGVAFECGDILFGKLRPYLAKAYLAESSGEAVGDFHVMRPSSILLGRYSIYQILNREFIAIVDGSTFGAKMPRVSWEFMANIAMLIPPLPEQRSIATFLDRETTKIDELITEQQRLIDLLKEKRQAVTSHAVTKGLNPDAPMKETAIEWLGEAPEGWEVKSLKNISPEITVGIVVEPSKYYEAVGVPALRSLNVQPGSIKFDNFVFISNESNAVLSKSRLCAGDLVSVRSGQPGTTTIIPPELDGCNCIDLIIIRKPKIDSEKFLCWYLNSDSAKYQFSEGTGGAIQQHFNVGTAMKLLIPTPPLVEQITIANFLYSETEKYDELIAEAQHAIALLQERRTALISAAVTGKIDVHSSVSPPD